jgi:hypothetical protein
LFIILPRPLFEANVEAKIKCDNRDHSFVPTRRIDRGSPPASCVQFGALLYPAAHQ